MTSPGPWKCGRPGWLMVVDANGDDVADLTWRNDEQRGYDTRLIAAAPEMLALVDWIASWNISSATLSTVEAERVAEARTLLARIRTP